MPEQTSKTPIEATDIRKGDLIRREQSGDRRLLAVEYIAYADGDSTRTSDSHFLLNRPVALPTEPGVYLDSHGEVWDRREDITVFALHADYAPYTLLRPVAEVAAEVIEAMRNKFNERTQTFNTAAHATAVKFGVVTL